MDADPAEPRAITTVADWVVAAGLVALGAGVVFAPTLAGGDPEAEARALRVAVSILCAVASVLWVLARRTRRDLRRMDDLLTDVRFGSGTRRDRDAVDILVRALRTTDERARETALRTLRKISGLDLGPDPAPWETWWAAARSTFVRAPGAPASAARRN